jgi:AraC family transcriptional regulator
MITDASLISAVHSINVAIYPIGATFGPRLLRDYEFVWLLEGDATYCFEKDGMQQEVPVPCGHLLLCQPQNRDSFVWDQKKRTRHGFFHFQLGNIPAHWPQPALWPCVRPMHDSEILAPLCQHILSLGPLEDKYQIRLAASLLLSAFVTGETKVGVVNPQKLPEPVERALDFVYKTLDEDAATPIALDSLAKVAFVTPEHLCRLFRNSTGHPPLETVRLARLDRAALLLSRSNYSITEIARMTGFSSPFHFSRAFKDAYGVSPRMFSQKLAEGETLPTPRLLRTLRPQNIEPVK